MEPLMTPTIALLLAKATTYAAAALPISEDGDRHNEIVPELGTWVTEVARRPEWEGVIVSIAYSDEEGRHMYSWEWTADGRLSSLN
jgi:hypothetical protein